MFYQMVDMWLRHRPPLMGNLIKSFAVECPKRLQNGTFTVYKDSPSLTKLPVLYCLPKIHCLPQQGLRQRLFHSPNPPEMILIACTSITVNKLVVTKHFSVPVFMHGTRAGRKQRH